MDLQFLKSCCINLKSSIYNHIYGLPFGRIYKLLSFTYIIFTNSNISLNIKHILAAQSFRKYYFFIISLAQSIFPGFETRGQSTNLLFKQPILSLPDGAITLVDLWLYDLFSLKFWSHSSLPLMTGPGALEGHFPHSGPCVWVCLSVLFLVFEMNTRALSTAYFSLINRDRR